MALIRFRIAFQFSPLLRYSIAWTAPRETPIMSSLALGSRSSLTTSFNMYSTCSAVLRLRGIVFLSGSKRIGPLTAFFCGSEYQDVCVTAFLPLRHHLSWPKLARMMPGESLLSGPDWRDWIYLTKLTAEPSLMPPLPPMTLCAKMPKS